MRFLTAVLVGMFFNVANLQAFESSPICKIKLIPKRDFMTLMFGVKASWVSVPNINKYSDCVKKAEDTLLEVNGPYKAESIVELLGKFILSIFEPEYYKAVKVTFTDVDGHKYKNKIKYKLPKSN